MPEIVHGPKTVAQQEDLSVDPKTGETRTPRYVGLRPDLEALAPTLGYAVYPYSINARGEGPVAELVVSVGAVDPATEPNTPRTVEWGFDASAIERTLWEHPKVKDILATASAADVENGTSEVAGLRKWVNQSLNGTPPSSSPSLFIHADIKKMAEKMLAGVEAFITPKVVVTMNASLPYQSTSWMPIADVGQVYTKAQLTSVGAPYTPPSDFTAKIPDGEYMTMAARHTVASDGSRQVEYQWDHADDWDDWIYKP